MASRSATYGRKKVPRSINELTSDQENTIIQKSTGGQDNYLQYQCETFDDHDELENSLYGGMNYMQLVKVNDRNRVSSTNKWQWEKCTEIRIELNRARSEMRRLLNHRKLLEQAEEGSGKGLHDKQLTIQMLK